MILKLSTNQRREDCAWVNAAAACIRPPKEILPEKYSGAATRIGRHDRDPAEAGRHPGQIGETSDQATGRGQHVVQVHLDPATLVLLTGRERNAIQMLVDPHQGEAQIRLAGIALGVAVDEAAPHPIAQQGSEHRIESRPPTT